MPSPVGHMLGGIAAGWLVAGRPTGEGRQGASVGVWLGGRSARAAAVFAGAGAAPDLDLLFGTHSTYSHSLGAVVLTGLAVLACTGGRRPRLALGCAAAVASHILLDWLGSDTTPPIGIMALWPVTREFYQSQFFVFDAISRRWWLPGFYAQNGLALVRELVLLGPVTLLVGLARRRAECQ